MTEQEARNLIDYLSLTMDDLEKVSSSLAHSGFDEVNKDITEAFVSIHTAIIRLEQLFPQLWKVQSSPYEHT